MVNKEIIKIRKRLDKLDNSLLSLIKKRSQLVDLVIKNKKFKKDIIDNKRIAIILKNITIAYLGISAFLIFVWLITDIF